MKVRFFINEEPEVHEVPLTEIPTFLELLKLVDLQDAEGSSYKMSSVSYDVHQHAFDVMCEEAG